MATHAADFRHARFFRSLTRRAAIFALRASHRATLRIRAFPFIQVAHGPSLLLQETDLFLTPGEDPLCEFFCDPATSVRHFSSGLRHTLSATCANANIPSFHRRTRAAAQQQLVGVPCLTSLIRVKATYRITRSKRLSWNAMSLHHRWPCERAAFRL